MLVDGDPTEDITATRQIAGVWKRGHAIDRDAYRRQVHLRFALQRQAKDSARTAWFGSGVDQRL